MRCCDPTCVHVWEIGYTEWPADKPCPACGSARDATDVKPWVVSFHEDAPEYDLIASLDEDCVAVIDTSGQILPFHILLHGVPGYNKMLCNFEPLHSEWFDENLFDKVV
jgi:NAD-dependent SIR2 family protein deacetylase